MVINQIVISGTSSGAQYSHHENGATYYKTEVETKRLSGTTDTITVIMPAFMKDITPGEKINVSGSIRSRREGNKLQNYIYADRIERSETEDTNEAVLEGYICSEPYRKQTQEKQLTQFIVCIPGKRPHYISVLVWKKNQLQIGDKIYLEGRMQSRTYHASEAARTVSEFSAYRAELMP